MAKGKTKKSKTKDIRNQMSELHDAILYTIFSEGEGLTYPEILGVLEAVRITLIAVMMEQDTK